MHEFLRLIMLLGLVEFLTTAADKKFDYESQIGIVDFPAGGGGCLTIKEGSLKPGSTVDLILMDRPQAHFSAVVEEHLAKACAHDTEMDTKTSAYHLRTLEKLEAGTPVGIGVTGFSGAFHVRNGTVRADLDGDGVEDSFRSCTSTEGLHLTVWKGEPLKGAKKWHRYYYLGYDVESDCTEKDY